MRLQFSAYPRFRRRVGGRVGGRVDDDLRSEAGFTMRLAVVILIGEVRARQRITSGLFCADPELLADCFPGKKAGWGLSFPVREAA